MIEVCFGVEPVMQPSPHRNPGGDCFACALTAALRWIYQQPDLPFDDCFDCFRLSEASAGKALVVSNSWPGMRTALYAASSRFDEFGRLEIFADIVDRPFEPERWSHCWFSGVTSTYGYAQRLEAWLRAGYVAISEINFAGSGPVVDGRLASTDHFVLIDGIRRYWKRHDTLDAASAHEEVHVVCSAKGAYWIDLREFMFKHGAAGWWLVRRDERGAWRDAA